MIETPFERLLHCMKKPWAMILYALLVVLIYHLVDKSVATYFYHLDLRVHGYALRGISFLGQALIYLVLFSLAGLYFRYFKRHPIYEARAWYWLICIVIPNLFCWFLKIILGRARPELLFAHHFFGFYWLQWSSSYWSFPSGHTMTVMGLAAGLAVVFPKFTYAFFLLAFFVALSRVLLYYHYISDVMVGFYLSVLLVGLFTPARVRCAKAIVLPK